MSTPMLNIALKAARAACTIMNRASDNLSSLEVHKKAHHDYVSEVDMACAGLEVLSVHQMGRHKTAAVRGNPEKLAALSGDVDVAPMNLQNVFVALCGHGDEG